MMKLIIPLVNMSYGTATGIGIIAIIVILIVAYIISFKNKSAISTEKMKFLHIKRQLLEQNGIFIDINCTGKYYIPVVYKSEGNKSARATITHAESLYFKRNESDALALAIVMGEQMLRPTSKYFSLSLKPSSANVSTQEG